MTHQTDVRPPTDEETARLGKVQKRLAAAALLELKSGDVPAVELLALFAHMTGIVLALQDRSEITPSQGLRLINANVLRGNKAGLTGLHDAAQRALRD